MYDKKIKEISSFESWAKENIDSDTKRISDLEKREEWVRERFEEQDKKFDDIGTREEWVRERFDEQNQKFDGIAKREEWVRSRFEEQDKKFDDIGTREEWVRNRLEEIDGKINKLYECVENINEKAYTIQDDFYNKKTYSQSGEDAIISYIFNFLNIDLTKINYLDLGANHAKFMSNTYAYYENGASGVLVEANPELIEELRNLRPRDVILNRAISLGDEKEVDFYILSGDGLSTIDKKEAELAVRTNPEIYIKEVVRVKTISVAEILNMFFTEHIDILSIDLEGIEDNILNQIDFNKYRPKVIILENIPYSPKLVIEQKEGKGKILLNNDYVEYAFTGINSIYLDKQYVEKYYNEKI